MVSPAARYEFVGMTGVVASEAMHKLLGTVARVAQTKATVLITGESGVGKELVARAVHHLSLRCGRPWVDVNCGALPEHLVESELFGYEKGAFSGASSTKQGLFELADTGTLFLDEIGELDPRMQVKLLRVLDGVPYYRLGGTRKVSADVRIVAATNISLEEATREGRFRKDLYYRLNQLRLQVPPLRERADDVEALAEYFLEQQQSALRLSRRAVEALRAYAWPGNVRELRGVITQAALLAESGVVEPEHLDIGAPGSAPRTAPSLGAMNLEEMERALILNGLAAAAGGNQTKAAAMLGISSRTIARKLKCYGITPERQPAIACNGTDRRREPRRHASGAVWLLFADEHGQGVTRKGWLLDESEHGFRARYQGAGLPSGAEVAFLDARGSGRARVAWSRTSSGADGESGFFVFEREDRS